MDKTENSDLCLFCHTDADGYVQPLPREGMGQAVIWHHPPMYGGWLLHFSGPHHTKAHIKIKFCPMCGRELKEG